MSKIRVLVVDDSVVVRRLVTEALAQDPMIEIAGSAANGKIALQRIPQLNPDLLTLDVEMPEMDGISTLRELRKTYPKLPVIMFSTLTAKGASATLDALAAGASDYVAKPANVGSVLQAIEAVAHELVPKIKALCRRAVVPPMRTDAPLPAPSSFRAPAAPPRIVCVGASTGGPNALAEVCAALPKNFPLPLVIVQHMPSMFTAMLAQRLTGLSPVPFHEITDRMPLQPGHGYIAPGGHHAELHRPGQQTVFKVHDGPPENSCRPAVDVLFRSVAAVFGAASLGVVLTGMGQDGMRGSACIREQQGQIIAQDEATSVVWGMPGSVVTAGYADKTLPLSQIAGEIVRRSLNAHRQLKGSGNDCL